MSIAPVSSGMSAPVNNIQSSARPMRAERENDGDKDDGSKMKNAAMPAPTVNTSGQIIGSTINVTA